MSFSSPAATAIQVGTANLINPKATMNIADGIERFLVEKHIGKLTDIIGTLNINLTD